MPKRGQAATQKRRSSSEKKEKEPPSTLTVQDAADRARDWLGERRDFYGYLCRRISGRGAPELGRHLRGDLLAKQSREGSWEENSVAATAEALWQLLDLGQPADSLAVQRGIDWLYGRRDQEGAFGSGCTPARHEQRICEHYLSGFFSPGPPDESQEITLPNGQTVTSDVGARLLASERALRVILRARPADPRTAASVSGLRSVPLYLDYGGTYTPAVLVGALQALAWVEGPVLSEVEAGLETLAGAQESDGTWPNVEIFFVIEALLEIDHALALRMIARTVDRLLETQLKYGAWGRRHQAAQTWIATRALEAVADSQQFRRR